MQTQEQLLGRWRYLRKLLLTQIERLESGALRIVSQDDEDAEAAVVRLKQEVLEFDRLIAESLGKGRPPS